jgi:hypothetical protein
MQFQPIQKDVLMYEILNLSGRPAAQAQRKRHGAFGRFLSGLGRFVGAIAAPLSFLFPPAGIAAAASYVGAGIGDFIQQKAAVKVMKQQNRDVMDAQQMGQIYIPGLTQVSMDLTRDTGMNLFSPTEAAAVNQVTDVLVARNTLDMEIAQSMANIA